MESKSHTGFWRNVTFAFGLNGNLSLQFPVVVECYTRGTVYSDKMLSFKISSEFI